jgi:hypothetical protein
MRETLVLLRVHASCTARILFVRVPECYKCNSCACANAAGVITNCTMSVIDSCLQVNAAVHYYSSRSTCNERKVCFVSTALYGLFLLLLLLSTGLLESSDARFKEELALLMPMDLWQVSA